MTETETIDPKALPDDDLRKIARLIRDNGSFDGIILVAVRRDELTAVAEMEISPAQGLSLATSLCQMTVQVLQGSAGHAKETMEQHKAHMESLMAKVAAGEVRVAAPTESDEDHVDASTCAACGTTVYLSKMARFLKVVPRFYCGPCSKADGAVSAFPG